MVAKRPPVPVSTKQEQLYWRTTYKISSLPVPMLFTDTKRQWPWRTGSPIVALRAAIVTCINFGVKLIALIILNHHMVLVWNQRSCWDIPIITYIIFRCQYCDYSTYTGLIKHRERQIHRSSYLTCLPKKGWRKRQSPTEIHGNRLISVRWILLTLAILFKVLFHQLIDLMNMKYLI